MTKVCKITIRRRTDAEMDKMVHEASWVGTVWHLNEGQRGASPETVIYGESQQEVQDRCMAFIKWTNEEAIDG